MPAPGAPEGKKIHRRAIVLILKGFPLLRVQQKPHQLVLLAMTPTSRWVQGLGFSSGFGFRICHQLLST